MAKLTCWKFMKCPESRHKECRSYLEHRGMDRWIVTGTMCRGEVQSSLEVKLKKCRECDYYKYIVFDAQEQAVSNQQ